MSKLEGSKVVARVERRTSSPPLSPPESGGKPQAITASNKYRETMKKFKEGKLMADGKTITNRRVAVRMAIRAAQAAARR